MAEEAVWGVGIIVRWILIFAVILLTIWALYNFLIKPIFGTFGNETDFAKIPAAPLLLIAKSFKRGKL